MSTVRSFEELHVWQHAMELATRIHLLTRDFPKDEMYGLTSQLRRAAYSVPSNITEGQARGGAKGFKHFLLVARGSLAEMQTQLLLAERLNYITNKHSFELVEYTNTVGRQLNALIKAISNRI